MLLENENILYLKIQLFRNGQKKWRQENIVLTLQDSLNMEKKAPKVFFNRLIAFSVINHVDEKPEIKKYVSFN